MARNRVRTSMPVKRPSVDSQVALPLVPDRDGIQSDNFRPYKGVTFYKRTGRWEANVWYENKQHYLGASFSALEAARAYDKAILFTRSSTDQLNFHPSDYDGDMEKMKGMSFVKYRQYLRDTSRKPNCQLVKKGILVDENGKWEVKYRLKNLQKPKYVLVGWFDTEEEAFRAYNATALHYDDYDEDSAIANSAHKKKLTLSGYPKILTSRRKKKATKAKSKVYMTDSINDDPFHNGLIEYQELQEVADSWDSPPSVDATLDVCEPLISLSSGNLEDDPEAMDTTDINTASILLLLQEAANISFPSTTVQQQLKESVESRENLLESPESIYLQSSYHPPLPNQERLMGVDEEKYPGDLPDQGTTELNNVNILQATLPRHISDSRSIGTESHYNQEAMTEDEYPSTMFVNECLLLVNFMRAEGYSDLQIVDFIWWMESEGNRATPDDEIEIQSIREIPISPEIIPKTPRDLSHLKHLGPFEIELSLSRSVDSSERS